ncbi:hypothetical protein Cni_G10753 [Canna indica]|uniref:Uncharacterized protein n=1 Tax=Canna indica TaxID=4628 RepID=A0AAQ3K538_9LILI|nr:hypothetical protein Cni_G10753 [Canna indica]
MLCSRLAQLPPAEAEPVDEAATAAGSVGEAEQSERTLGGRLRPLSFPVAFPPQAAAAAAAAGSGEWDASCLPQEPRRAERVSRNRRLPPPHRRRQLLPAKKETSSLFHGACAGKSDPGVESKPGNQCSLRPRCESGSSSKSNGDSTSGPVDLNTKCVNKSTDNAS